MSGALPSWMYRDPAEIVERNEMNELGCKACKKSIVFFGLTRCEDPRNENQKGVPGIGHRCRIYVERV